MNRHTARRSLLAHRPALLVAIGLAIGITAQYDLDGFVWIPLLVVTVLAVALRVFIKGSIAPALVFVSSVILGALLSASVVSQYTHTPLEQLARHRPKTAVLTGQIDNVEASSNAQTCVLIVDSIGFPGQAAVPFHGRVYLYYWHDDSATVAPLIEGARSRVYAALAPFRPPTNPREYATELVVQSRTCCDIQGEIRSRYDVYQLTPPAADPLRQARHVVDRMHERIVSVLGKAIPNKRARAFVLAVVLGEREALGKPTLKEFSEAGVTHILAVSGFNVAIVSLVFAALLRLFGVYWRGVRIMLTMLLVIGYALLVGLQPSVVRSLLMIELYYLSRLLERRVDPLNVIASAICIELVLRPLDLLDVGFQLSYSAVLGLLVLTPHLRRICGIGNQTSGERPASLWYHISDGALLSISATLGSLPVLVSHFYRMSLVGLAMNILAIPLSSAITALGFLIVPLSAISSTIGGVYGQGVEFLSFVLFLVTGWASRLPFASITIPPPNAVGIALYLLPLFYLLSSSSVRQVIARLLLCALGVSTLMLAGLQLREDETSHPGTLQVIFFDVGQGDCILLRTPSNRCYVIDCGPISRAGNASIDRAVIPFLRSEGITHIDGAFISHMHRDHFGGAVSLHRELPVHCFYTSGERVADHCASDLEREAKNVPKQILKRGDVLHLDTDIALYVLNPPSSYMKELRTASGQHINSGSLAFKIVFGGTSFLFLGDMERSEEEAMLRQYGGFLQSTVVKVAHHGSLTSSSREFTKSVSPKYAVVSVGEQNTFGHPAPAILRRWLNVEAKVYRTDRDGAILFTSDGYTVSSSRTLGTTAIPKTERVELVEERGGEF